MLASLKIENVALSLIHISEPTRLLPLSKKPR